MFDGACRRRLQQRSLGALVAGLLGTTYTSAQMTYDLRRLRLHGLIARFPRSNTYMAIWRNHRLHHFKNEHFWHGVTNNLSDKMLGTNPDQRDVSKSKTARTLAPE